ncbi:hypothetical protein SARC_04260 [Sphaeroforma arctica JP610]|uniref:HECT-type E3 ubiquitin transferase n=1 Tax=Sphaeroforma arctica JP610 TaxID=667725 RepID=A0A0L0G3P3_9EUKA|nr:hypothetical protein SARC_04260 [Sphaeroforma arctica JP610]KNC83479.1 hypothetical protein SARC_04260 [Sphaeroforma arctica JP610]|eukprot:XP_014157381.1 hypothetical protein SARC_04260 [Sphaeroforma arctica JP610]
MAVMKDREIARKFASVGDGLAESGSTSLDATDRRGDVPVKTGDMSGGERTGVCGSKPGDVNRVLALYGNTVALGKRMIAIEKQRTPTSTEVTSTGATTTRATTTPEHTRAGPDTAHTRERYVQSLYSLTKVCLREIAASKERARTSSSATSELHPMLGMTSVRTGKDWKPVLHGVHAQVKRVWESAHLHAILMEDLGRCCESPSAANRRRGSGTRSEAGKLLRRYSSKRSSGVVTRQGSSASADERREMGGKIIDLSAALRVCKACQLLYMLPSVFPDDKHMLWNRITCMPGALSGLYRLLLSVGPSGGMAVFLTAACNQPSAEVMLPILLLFCDCCTNLLVTLDDTDMHEEHKVLTLLDFRFLVRFLIRFIYNLIIVGRKKNRSDKCYKTSLSSTHALLRALRDRDSARNFTQESDWRLPLQILNMRKIDEMLDTIAVGTPAHTKADSATIEAYNQLILYMPHLIPFKRR